MLSLVVLVLVTVFDIYMLYDSIVKRDRIFSIIWSILVACSLWSILFPIIKVIENIQ